jgi:3-oxoacyl-[acyl-carrier-protein] synthase I
LRLKERLRAPTDVVAPAEAWGDVGAAGAPLHVAIAVISHRKRYAGPVSLVFGGSEDGQRGAAIVRAHRAPSRG